MNILVIGNGGREHAIIWKLKQSPGVKNIYCTVGNAGICNTAACIHIKPENIEELISFAKANKIDFTVVGPEVPLSLGVTDRFIAEGLKIFGPTKNAAMLETSKTFAKEFMRRYNIPSAGFKKFSIQQKAEAIDYLSGINYPIVIKADGLAAGKGVIISEDRQNALNTINEIFERKIFGSAGNSVVIEDFLIGNEASVFAISDGTDYIILSPAQDHKKIMDGEKGKNTGGMGSFAPADKLVTKDLLDKIKKRIIEPVIENMKKEGNEFKGCLYCGLMIDENNEPYVIEFNTRFGDPETQVVLPKIESDFLDMLLCSANGKIKDYKLMLNNNYYCSVVLASKGYPDKYESGKEITGLEKVNNNCIIFHAGTKSDNGKVLSSGGRVLNVVGTSTNNLKESIDNAYENLALINYENKYYRTDIAKKGLSN